MSHACVGMVVRSVISVLNAWTCPRKRGTWHPKILNLPRTDSLTTEITIRSELGKSLFIERQRLLSPGAALSPSR